MKFPSSIFIFLYPHSHNRVMNRVSPIFEDEHESSADSIHRRLEVRVTHCTAQEEGTAGPRTCKICLEEEAAK
jgi:guanylate kinase